MSDVEQYYLRGQIEALYKIHQCLERLQKSGWFRSKNDFFLVFLEAEKEIEESVKSSRYNNDIHDRALDWSANADQWLMENQSYDYDQFMDDWSNRAQLKNKLIYTDVEKEAIRINNLLFP